MSCFESFVFFGINWMSLDGKKIGCCCCCCCCQEDRDRDGGGRFARLADLQQQQSKYFQQTILEEPLQRVMLCVSVQTCCSSWRTENVFVCAFVDERERERGREWKERQLQNKEYLVERE